MTRQPARSVASQNPSTGSVLPSLSGNSRQSSVSAASATGSDTGQRSGTGSGTRRSSASSSVRTGPAPSFIPPTPSKTNGFPTFADTHWGDPIAMAVAEAAKGDSRRKSGSEDDAEGGGTTKKLTKSARKRKNKARTAQVQAQIFAPATQASALDVDIPPGGPGSSWGDPNEAW